MVVKHRIDRIVPLTDSATTGTNAQIRVYLGFRTLTVDFFVIKGALYRIYQVIILCRRFPAKFSDIVSPARDSHA